VLAQLADVAEDAGSAACSAARDALSQRLNRSFPSGRQAQLCAVLVAVMDRPGCGHEVLSLLWVVLMVREASAPKLYPPTCCGATRWLQVFWQVLVGQRALERLCGMVREEWGVGPGVAVEPAERLRSAGRAADEALLLHEARRWWLQLVVEVVRADGSSTVKRQVLRQLLGALEVVVERWKAGRPGAELLIGPARQLMELLGVTYLVGDDR
jgi:hypothetical protein